jgi:mycothiol synthase
MTAKERHDIYTGPIGFFEEVHGRMDYQFPQLEMVLYDITDPPTVCLPENYTIRNYLDGDENAWGEIMSEAFQPYWDAGKFLIYYKPHFGFSPERVFFVCHNGRPIGSACAFSWPGLSKDQGYIHMVGVLKEHCGKGLGYWLTVSCLKVFSDQGFSSVMLQTEDFRIPAIKHYLNLGFSPVLIKENQREIWAGIFRLIDREKLINDFNLNNLEVMGRLSFWWRTWKIMKYMSWLKLKNQFF